MSKMSTKEYGPQPPPGGPIQKKAHWKYKQIVKPAVKSCRGSEIFSVLTLWSTTTDASKSASQTKSCCVRPGGVSSLTICSTPKHCMMVGEIVFSGLVWNKFGQKGYTNRIYFYIITGEQLSIWLEIETDSRFQFPKLTTTLTSGIY